MLRATLELGYCPDPYNPDPKDLNFSLHYTIVYLTLLGALISIPTQLTVQLAAWRLSLPILDRSRYFVIWSICFSALLAAMYLDVGDFWVWFFD